MAEYILSIADSILFVCISLSGIYLLIFSLPTMFGRADKYPKTKQKHRYALLLPTGTPPPELDYPKELYDIHFYDKLPEAVQGLECTKYEMAVILGTTSGTSSNLLQEINNAYDAGVTAMQLHPIIEQRSTRKLRSQAIDQEVKNSFFKQGHTLLGLSSAMNGVDIAVELKWLQKNLKSEKSNLGRRLLRQRIFIDYIESAHIYCAAARKCTHVIPVKKALSDFPEALLSGNWDYADRLFQRLLPSWKTLLTATTLLSVVATYLDGMLSIKWWVLLFGLLLTVCFAIPDYLIEPKKKRKSKKD